MYVHTYVRTHICTYTHMYVHTYVRTHICTYTHMYVHTYVRTHICTYTYVRIHMYVYICTYTYVRIHMYMYICICIYIYVYIYNRSSNSKVTGSRPSRGRQHLSACAGYGNYIIHTLEHFHLNIYIYFYVLFKRSKPAAHKRTCRAYLLFMTSWIDKISSCAGNIYGIFVIRDM